tara:strand:- start:561 stop:980 length:420 start_codon:yes stop_codon:yes gene_type:complete
MGTTTFSGPIKAGSGSNIGSAVMAQSKVIDIIGASVTDQVCATIPANSQIIDVIVNVSTVSNDGGTATVSVGTSADPNAFISALNVKALGTTHGTLDTEATDIGTSDLQILADTAMANGDGTTGAATVTVMYIQNNNLS